MHVEKCINQGVVYTTCTGDRYSLRMHVLKLLGPWNIESRILAEMSMLPLAKPQKKLVFFKFAKHPNWGLPTPGSCTNNNAPHSLESFLTQIKSRCCEVASSNICDPSTTKLPSRRLIWLLTSNPIKLMTGYSPPGTSIVMLFPFSRIWSSFVIFLPSGVVSLSRGGVPRSGVKVQYVNTVCPTSVIL